MRQIAPIETMQGPCVMAQSKLTHDRVRAALFYDPAVGDLLWRMVQSNRVKVGQVAGAIATNGRRYINIDGEKHLAHRLVWFYVKGIWPEGNVAPINGDYLDTHIENLKEESLSETARKGGGKRTGVSGIPGVSWDAGRQKWIAIVNRDYKPFHLGRFDTKEAAGAAVEAAGGAVFAVSREERMQRAQSAAIRRRQRNLWERTRQAAGGVVGWRSIDDFIADVGTAPKSNHALAPIDTSKPIGPGNFAWCAPLGFDYGTRDGRVAYNRAHRQRHPNLYRDKELRKKFDIGLTEYNDKLNSQFGVCAICEKDEPTFRHGKRQSLPVDHDHSTDALRDLLCTKCNQGIGSFCDDPALLRKAALYLERHASGKLPWHMPSVTEITHLPVGQALLQESDGDG